MTLGKVSFCVLLGAGALSTPAYAQEMRRLDFGLQGRVEYNSNVARTDETQAAIRGLTPGDTIFTPAATFDLLLPVGRQSLFLLGSAGYSFYDNNKDLDRERVDLTGGVNTRFGPCAATFSGGYARGINRIDDPVLIDNVRNIQETERLGVDVSCSRQTGLGVVGAMSKEWTSNELSFLRVSDSERTTGTVGVSYSRPALGTLTVFGNHEETIYPNRLVEDGYDMNAFGATFERQLGARIEGSVTVSYAMVEEHVVLPGQDSDSDSVTYAARLGYRASSRLRFQAMFDRAVLPSSSIGRSYDLTQSYRVTADYDMGSRITFSLGAGRAERNAGGTDLPILQLTDSTTTTFDASVRYKQSERLSFLLSGGHEERTTNAPQFDYTNDRIGLTADVRF